MGRLVAKILIETTKIFRFFKDETATDIISIKWKETVIIRYEKSRFHLFIFFFLRQILVNFSSVILPCFSSKTKLLVHFWHISSLKDPPWQKVRVSTVSFIFNFIIFSFSFKRSKVHGDKFTLWNILRNSS